jgi:hypothetical protein
MMVAGGAGGVLAIFFLFVALERHARVRRLVRDMERVRRGKLAQIPEKRYAGALRVLARSFNEGWRGAPEAQGAEPAEVEPAGKEEQDTGSVAAVPVTVPEEKTEEKAAPMVVPPPAPAPSMGGAAVPLRARSTEGVPGRRIVVPVSSPAVSGHAGSGGHASRSQRSAPRREALAALAIGEALAIEAGPEPSEMEYQDVYQEFVAAKRSLGESVEGLSFDRFVEKLRQNRAELIQRNACRTVKFSVYIKDGRAAIRATPLYR